MDIVWPTGWNPALDGFNQSFAVVPTDINLDQSISYQITYTLNHSQ